jgi:uncharacterized membrane protein
MDVSEVAPTAASFAGGSSVGIELLAVAIIVLAIFGATGRYLWQRLRRAGTAYEDYRHAVARALLLGLEILVAADVIRTVALEPTLASLTALGLLVVIRTFLSWSLVLEIEGRWPWQRPKAERQ